jgi:hypothetical protein
MDNSELFAMLGAAGMPPVPREFSVVPTHQAIGKRILDEVERFVAVFDAVTSRPQWQRAVTRRAPSIARVPHTETCFFSAWDIHIPPSEPERWKLIEFNDNGSGFMFAACINRLYYEWKGLASRADLEPPPLLDDFARHIADMVEHEARKFFGHVPEGLFLILDDEASLASGKFRREHEMLRTAFEARGWRASMAPPSGLSADASGLRVGTDPVSFVVNRSTDFFWEASAFEPLRAAWSAGSVYVAPNPFTYATRSDKSLLIPLPGAGNDLELGIEPAERAVLDAHVPSTLPIEESNLDELARRKRQLVFKPAHGHAGRGLLRSDQLGRSRLRRLLASGEQYVAQMRVPRPSLKPQGAVDARLWTDFRVWAYAGKRFLISGRASTDPDGLELGPPGGWLPTYCRR